MWFCLYFRYLNCSAPPRAHSSMSRCDWVQRNKIARRFETSDVSFGRSCFPQYRHDTRFIGRAQLSALPAPLDSSRGFWYQSERSTGAFRSKHSSSTDWPNYVPRFVPRQQWTWWSESSHCTFGTQQQRGYKCTGEILKISSIKQFIFIEKTMFLKFINKKI